MYIPQVDGADVVNKDYEIKSFKKYKVALDYSLDLIELKKIYKKYLPAEKCFFRNSNNRYDKKIYSDLIVSVNFNYRTDNLSIFEIREVLYRDGFYINNKKYVRFKRSSGSSRVGKCLFIREELYEPMMEFSYMGLKFSEDEQVDLAGLEAYISLTTSSIINTIKLSPKNILVIDDYNSDFYDFSVVTKVVDEKLITKKENVKISNCIFDGQSLLDVSVFNDNSYSDKGMLLLRNNFFKSCCFNTNIQKFFKDNNITKVKQLNGFTLAKNIKDIKLITTPSSIKYLKFGTIEEYLSRIDDNFGVVKYDKPPHFLNGNRVQTHYQLLNTLELSKEEIELFLQDTVNYIKLLKNDTSVMREHLKMTLDKKDNNFLNFDTSNHFIYSMLLYNDEISKTNIYSNFLKDLVRNMQKKIKNGHILVNGNYSTLFGNGLEMLFHSIGKFDGESIFKPDEIMTTRFDYNKTILAIRSPHITMGNIWCPKNVFNKKVNKYFNLTDNIVMVNSIKSNILERLNGCDFDSDTVLLTDDKILIKSALKNYKKFLVPTSQVISKKTARYNNFRHKTELDDLTSENKIGEIVNLSQILNSLLWEIKKSDLSTKSKFKKIDDIYFDICKLAVLSTIEIDKAKKEFSIDMDKEIKTIRKKYPSIKNRIPYFFRGLDVPKSFLKPIEKYSFYETSMDYLYFYVSNIGKLTRRESISKLNLSDLFYLENFDNNDLLIANRLKNIINDFSIQKNLIWDDNSINGKEKYILINNKKQEIISKIKKMKITKEILSLFLSEIKNTQQRMVICFLFKANQEIFYDLLKEKEKNVSIIKLYDKELKGKYDEILNIYGLKYKKVSRY